MAFIPHRDVGPVAKASRKQFKSLPAILAAPAGHLAKVEKTGETAFAYLNAIGDLNYRAARESIKARDHISYWSAPVVYVCCEIIELLQPFGISLQDDLIVGTGGAFSFRSARPI